MSIIYIYRTDMPYPGNQRKIDIAESR